jgi:hypothetical protein
MKTALKILAAGLFLLAGYDAALALDTNLAQRIDAEVQTAGMESLPDLTWLQGSTPAVEFRILRNGKAVALSTNVVCRMLISSNLQTGTLYAQVTNVVLTTNATASSMFCQWPTIGTNSAGTGTAAQAWGYLAFFEDAATGTRYWNGSGNLYIEKTTSTEADGLNWYTQTEYGSTVTANWASNAAAWSSNAAAWASNNIGGTSAGNYLPLAGGTMTGDFVTLARDVKSRDAVSVGFAGAAFGYGTTAGEYGAAFGDDTTAGEYGAAFGYGTSAGVAGLASGLETSAGNYGFAAGESTSAGYAGFAAGAGSSAGNYGFAVGAAAKGADGSFIFADNSAGGMPFNRTNSPNSFSVRAAGGTYFDTPLFTVTGEVAAARIALGTNAAVSNWPSGSGGITAETATNIAEAVVGGWVFDGFRVATPAIVTNGAAHLWAESNAWWTLDVTGANTLTAAVPWVISTNGLAVGEIPALAVKVALANSETNTWSWGSVLTNSVTTPTAGSTNLFMLWWNGAAWVAY